MRESLILGGLLSVVGVGYTNVWLLTAGLVLVIGSGVVALLDN